MSRFSYYLFRGFLVFHFIVPMPLLYLVSDFFAFIMYRVVKYRRKVVESNLKKCFPEYSDEKRKEIAKKFYKNLCDISLESIKGFTMNPKNIMKRYKMINENIVHKFHAEGRNIIYAGSHYANWEWGTQAAGFQMIHKPIGLYKPMTNKYIDAYIKMHRKKRGVEFVSIYDTGSLFRKKFENPVGIVMVGDQSPSNVHKAIWTDFFGIDTACLHGIEYYAKLYNIPIVYIDVQRIKRGYYELEMKILFENPAAIEEKGAITTKYMQTLEEIIRKKPEDWLWSHRRWKDSRESSK